MPATATDRSAHRAVGLSAETPSILSGPSANPVNAWTYVAFTYDGATVRLYINGTQVASRAASGAIQTTNSPLWIGGNSPYGEYFQGLIDEARVYNRALTQAEIQSDMNTSIVPTAPDTSPPTAPTGLTATASGSSQVNLNWTASTDNVGVAGYRVERCQGAGCTNFAQVGTPTATSYSDTGLAPSSTYRYQVRAVDASGNLSGYSAVASASTPAQSDTTPPSAPTGLSATAISSSRIDLGWTASTDNVGVAGYRVERCQGTGCTNFAQVAPPTATTYSDTGLSPSTTYRYQVRAVDAAGNLSPYSVIATATTPAATDTTPPSAPTGLSATAVSASRIDLNWTASTDNVGVAGYRVERCQGTNCTNFAQVGNAHRHHLQQHGASGKHQLPLPRASGRCRGEPESLLRHRDRSNPRQRHHATDRSDGAHRDGGGPDGRSISAGRPPPTTSASPATRSSAARAGAAPTSPRSPRPPPPPTATAAWRPRPPTATGSGRSMPPATSAPTPMPPRRRRRPFWIPPPPTAPSGLTATAAGSSQVGLSWTASTDNVGVAGYRVERCQGAGCTNFAQIATPTATNYSDTAVCPRPPTATRSGRSMPSGNLSPLFRDRPGHHRRRPFHAARAWSEPGRSPREPAPPPPTPPATGTPGP